MRRKLTDRLINSLKAIEGRRLVIVDAEVRGLCLRVMPTGARSWLVRYRLPRQAQKAHVVGSYPGISLSAARQRARDVTGAGKRGVDLPAQERRDVEDREKAAATARTVSQLATEFIENYAKPHHRRWRDTELRLHNHVLPKLGNRAVGDVRRADITELLDDLEHRKKLRQQVNRVRSVLSSMFKFAIEREYAVENPVSGTRARKLELERSRTLDDAELRAVWRAVDDVDEPARSFIKTLLLTAVRRDEARCMRWDEINSAGDLWVVPAARTKAAKDFEVPLSRQMVKLLAQLPRCGPFVFSIDGRRPWTRYSRLKGTIDLKSGITGWRYHDLRRTARSRWSEMRVSYEVCERLLNHSMPKLARVYDRHSYRQEKARALQAWSDRLMQIVGDGRAAANVVTLRPGG